jgi:hypothetical protein
MNKTIICAVMLLLIAGIASADNPGAIWTTKIDCGDETQDVNHYAIGDDVYIHGANFNPGVKEWSIEGQPGGASCDPNIVVASGNITIGSSGEFCINAYTVQVGDCGEYKANVGNKNDNYRVDEPTTPTTTPTTSTIPNAPEFGALGMPLAVLLIVPAFAYLVIARRKE